MHPTDTNPPEPPKLICAMPKLTGLVTLRQANKPSSHTTLGV
jgi:hypothetical protein